MSLDLILSGTKISHRVEITRKARLIGYGGLHQLLEIVLRTLPEKEKQKDDKVRVTTFPGRS